MIVLVLGGTKFLGRHIVERLAATGHRVVCFHRGRTTAALPGGVEERHGDRDKDFSAVHAEHWDAIVDTSGYRPEQLQRSLDLQTDRYLFVSSVSAYRDLSIAGITEDAPTIEEFDPSDEAAVYGGNKAACERLVIERRGDASTILRPGLIAGRWDFTDRFTYWCERFVRGGTVLAPGPPDRLVQFIDAADIAEFVEHAIVEGIGGTFNVVGPAMPATMQTLLDDCATVADSRNAPPSTVVWTDGAYLKEEGVQEWTELPLWITDPQYAGLLQVSGSKALEAGLRLRPTAQTIETVVDWIARDQRPVNRAGMTPERELELLARYAPSA
ncbi:MAG: hypothetical protein JO263_04785 [Candidatus Eremiobacteraeota bacterium]|nr:hypothetical protein [Candidatus Eremiobacteraeota bacterium]